jgi:CSLREA domain-containing protein
VHLRRIRHLPLVAGLLVALVLAGLWPASAYAAGITVTTTADAIQKDGKCSLREAIIAANTDKAVDTCAAGKGADTITLAAGTYTLGIAGGGEDAAARGDLDITSNVIIKGSGAGATIIDGNRLDRVLDIKKGAALTISGVSIRNGDNLTELDAGGIANHGTLVLQNGIVRANHGYSGGISNDGTATIASSTIENNGAAEDGGGIWNRGTLTVANSTIRNNTSGEMGGGFANSVDGKLAISNSTISYNEGGSGGGAMMVYYNSTVSLSNSTVSDNSGGGIETWWGSPGIKISVDSSTVESIVDAENASSAVIVKNSIVGSCGGRLTSQGYNLIQNPSGCTIAGDTTGNRLNLDPKLGPLQDNGGPTMTRALLIGSPAIDAGNPATPGSAASTCPPTDQRAVVRAQDGNGDGRNRCDIGAFEVLAPTLLRNGGFELDANGNGRPDSWSSNSHFTRSSTSVQSGRYAGRHRASDNTSYTVSQSIAGVRAGSAYVFSGYVNAPATSDGFTFKLQLRWRNASGTSIRTDTVASLADDTTGKWQRVWASKVTPSGAASVQVAMVLSSLKASIYVDSFALRLAPTTSGATSAAEMLDVFGDEAAPQPADPAEAAEPAG